MSLLHPQVYNLIKEQKPRIYTAKPDLQAAADRPTKAQFYAVLHVGSAMHLLGHGQPQSPLGRALTQYYDVELIASAPGLLAKAGGQIQTIIKFTRNQTVFQDPAIPTVPANQTALKQVEHTASEARAMEGDKSIDEQIAELPHRGRGVVLYGDVVLTEHAIDRIKQRVGAFSDIRSLVRAVLHNQRFATDSTDQATGAHSKKIDYKGYVYVFNEDFSCLITTFPSYNTRSGQKQLYEFNAGRDKAFRRKPLDKYNRAKQRRKGYEA
jgi:hypothetical protein